MKELIIVGLMVIVIILAAIVSVNTPPTPCSQMEDYKTWRLPVRCLEYWSEKK